MMIQKTLAVISVLITLSYQNLANAQPMTIPSNAEFVFSQGDWRFYLLCRSGTDATCPNKNYIYKKQDGSFSAIYLGVGTGAKIGEEVRLAVDANCKNATVKMDKYDATFITPEKNSVKDAMMKVICNY